MDQQHKDEKRTKKAISEIGSLKPRVSQTIARLEDRLTEAETALGSDRFASDAYCCSVAIHGSLVRTRRIIGQDFVTIDDFGLLATTRYMLELQVWARLLSQDPSYGFTYIKADGPQRDCQSKR